MKTEILCIIDRSGSMSSIRADAEGGFNSFVAEQKKVPGDARLTITEFDTVYDYVCKGVDIKDAPEYRLVPRGSTALLDAMGRTMEEQGKRISDEKWAEKVIMVIVTDGQENSSREFTGARIKEMTEHAQKNGWSFIYLAANVDVSKTAAAMGINLKSAMNSTQAYAATAAGVRGVYTNASLSVTNLRGGGTAH